MAVDFSKKFEGFNIGAMNPHDNLFGKAAPAAPELLEMEIDKILAFPKELLPEACQEMFDDYSDEDMEELTDSIQKHGVLQPILLRLSSRTPGFYEILAGHHRLEGARRARLNTIPYRLIDADDDTACSIFVETNLNQRKHLSWKTMAYAYQMDLDSLSHQGKRTDLQDDSEYNEGMKRLETAAGKSKRTILQIARLTKLYPPFFEWLEQKRIPFTAAYHLTFLPQTEQSDVYAYLQENPDIVLTVQHAEELHKTYEAQKWNRFTVRDVCNPPVEKPLRTGRPPMSLKPVSVKIPPEVYHKYFPDLEPKEAGEKLIEILEQYFSA